MEETCDRVEVFVQTDLPFLIDERRDRVDRARQMATDEDVPVTDALDQLMEALFVEVEYGNTVDVYRETIMVDDREAVVDVVRLGRAALFYQTLDGKQAGRYSRDRAGWEPLEGRWRRGVSAAMEMALKRRPSELICLPMGRPVESRLAAEGFASATVLEDTETKAVPVAAKDLEAVAGQIRRYAQEARGVINNSPQSGTEKNRGAFLNILVRADHSPRLADLEAMVDLLMDEALKSGRIRLVKGTVIDPAGREQAADLLMAGNLTTLYQTADDTGYALYSETGGRFFALSRSAGWRVDRVNRQYLSGNRDAFYMDITQGAALREMVHRPGLAGQIAKGGPIVWPILAILVLGLAIIIERAIYLWKRTCDAETFMALVGHCIAGGQWDACRLACEKNQKQSVPRVIGTAVAFGQMDRESMENALQEAILNEVPRLERFLSTLGLLAAIAPLLGLLGTVTGMIQTFHVITYYGTGDARMLSGGISEALVTTMLGLCVAIPLMLGHTLLTRKVETLIGQMEEKAVAFVNMIFKSRTVAP